MVTQPMAPVPHFYGPAGVARRFVARGSSGDVFALGHYAKQRAVELAKASWPAALIGLNLVVGSPRPRSVEQVDICCFANSLRHSHWLIAISCSNDTNFDDLQTASVTSLRQPRRRTSGECSGTCPSDP